MEAPNRTITSSPALTFEFRTEERLKHEQFFKGAASVLCYLNGDWWGAYSGAVSENLRSYDFNRSCVTEFILNNLSKRLIEDQSYTNLEKIPSKYFNAVIRDLQTSEISGFHTLLINLKITEIALKALEALEGKKLKKIDVETRIRSIQTLIGLLEMGELTTAAQLLLRKSSEKSLFKLLKNHSLSSEWEADLLVPSSLKEILTTVIDQTQLEKLFKEVVSNLSNTKRPNCFINPETSWQHTLQLDEAKPRYPKMTTAEFFRNCITNTFTISLHNSSKLLEELQFIGPYFAYNGTEQMFTSKASFLKEEYLSELLFALGYQPKLSLINEFLNLNVKDEEAKKAFLISYPEFQMLYYVSFGAFSLLGEHVIKTFQSQNYMAKANGEPNHYLHFLTPNQVTQVKKYTVENTLCPLMLSSSVTHPRAKVEEITLPRTLLRSYSKREVTPSSKNSLSRVSSAKALPDITRFSLESTTAPPAHPLEYWKQKKQKWLSKNVATFWATVVFDLSQVSEGIIKPNVTFSIDTLEFNPFATKLDSEFVVEALKNFGVSQ